MSFDLAEMEAIEAACLTGNRKLIAMVTWAVRNNELDPTTGTKPLKEWTVEDILAAATIGMYHDEQAAMNAARAAYLKPKRRRRIY